MLLRFSKNVALANPTFPTLYEQKMLLACEGHQQALNGELPSKTARLAFISLLCHVLRVRLSKTGPPMNKATKKPLTDVV